MYSYAELKKEYVIAKLGNGERVICVDFKTMRCYDCETMTVGAIRSYMDSTDTVFFTKTEVTDES